MRRSEPPLDRYLNAWALETAGELIETHTSWLLPVRRIDGPAVLKLLKPDSDEHAGTALLRYFAGIGAVRLLADDAGALLMERADSRPSLVALAVSGHDDAAAAILAECVAQLHAPRTHPPPPGLISLSDRFQALFAQETQTPLLARCAAVARHLLATERETTALHGDLHHDNVLPANAAGSPSIRKACAASVPTRWPTCCAIRSRMATLCITLTECDATLRSTQNGSAWIPCGYSASPWRMLVCRRRGRSRTDATQPSACDAPPSSSFWLIDTAPHTNVR